MGHADDVEDHVERFKKNSVDLMRPSMENCQFPQLVLELVR
jgi:hypothetical protein